MFYYCVFKFIEMKLLVLFALCVLSVAASPIEGPQTAIVNGNDVPLDNPATYHVHLLLISGQVTHVGSGVYIGSTWVVTVAHHIKPTISELRCGFGNRDRNLLTWIQAFNYILHPYYNPYPLDNNIALIHLLSVPLAPTTAIPLALPGTIQVGGTEGTIFGFGFTTNEGFFATILQQASKTIETDAACLVTFPHLSDGLLARNFCAIGAGVAGNVPSMCAGDHGGPFVVDGVLIGISSFMRSSNCLSGASSGFVRISAFRAWILAISNVPVLN